MRDVVFTIRIDGVTAPAKGVQWEAVPQSTVTGVTWTISGNLAKAIAAYVGQLDAKPEHRSLVSMERGV